MDTNDDKSSSASVRCARGCSARILETAACPLRRFRTGMNTSAPAPASFIAISSPIPSLAPVTTARCPDRSGMSTSYGVRGM
ncbi:apolipoprotein N-acyltransferase [Mycobacteroides abscessus subsp. abscessus]|nr:apolipoprotein N-acyltransferase [Mycobacteroides abscessus subsp. abscessus]SKU89615.1 apolipoprotein N-acyltransferase [Mycobacteroides abscessus subsp. abscessus]